MPRIAAVATRGLAELIRRQLPEFRGRAEVSLIERSGDEAVDVIQGLVRSGLVDAVIAAGQTAERLRTQLAIPVSPIPVAGYDILHALARASELAPRIVLLTRSRLAESLVALRPLLRPDVNALVYDRDDEARQLLRDMAQHDRPVIVGSSQIVHLAREAGLPAVLVYSAGSIAVALEAALELVRVARAEEAKRRRLDHILESLSEGVVAVDADERVQTLNPALARLLGVSPAWAAGRRLSDIEPLLSLAAVIRDGEARRDEVTQLAGRPLVTQRLPLREGDVTVGAVLTLQDATAIERAERSLRVADRRRAFRARYRLEDVIGESPAIVAARVLAQSYAESDAAVLIEGGSGTGKELFAQGIHLASRRAVAPFVALNCAAFPEQLLESELFGYEDGAFTGSRRGGKPGLIELANRGTLFLDEIGDMPLPLQTRLLRVLQEREVLRLGGGEPVPVDVRIIAATHADLRRSVGEGRFRADLYYRLNILSLRLPALAERGEDLRLLAGRLARDAMHRAGATQGVDALLAPLLEAARSYPWPGNVRELQNVIERLAVALRGRVGLDQEHIRQLVPELALSPATPVVAQSRQSRRAMAEQALAAARGDRAGAAKQLGISRTTLWRWLGEPT
ncbi:propionate catabolism operon regulatory protein PrpR [Chitinimonas sp. BJYL2]|uniref:propionate catabolism operon regulatory protein PrpR n=1 Tax=Chitinimonas sp. BJYL2 TaxID=2976696 RepID=UPI0022B2E562|nr:propionate catabolism operon regulatory protein PrpR [Chitinimonas sp. BJYL2]